MDEDDRSSVPALPETVHVTWARQHKLAARDHHPHPYRISVLTVILLCLIVLE